MYRKCISQLCWLVALGCASIALGQNPYVYTPYNPYAAYNPFSQVGGSAGTRLSQYYQQSGSRPNNLPQQSSMGAARIGLGVGNSTSGAKPFSSYTAPPTVSPYLNLFRQDLRGDNAFNYSTLVQPLLQQQQTNQQLQRQQMQTSRRLQSIAAENEYNPQGSRDLAPTGHQTVFMYMGHYYPATTPHRRQR